MARRRSTRRELKVADLRTGARTAHGRKSVSDTRARRRCPNGKLACGSFVPDGVDPDAAVRLLRQITPRSIRLGGPSDSLGAGFVGKVKMADANCRSQRAGDALAGGESGERGIRRRHLAAVPPVSFASEREVADFLQWRACVVSIRRAGGGEHGGLVSVIVGHEVMDISAGGRL
ncbi:hypothetical protein VTO73DRAFT_9744 [Trametes versicolor]